MFAHATTATKHEVDDVNAIDVENGKRPRVWLRVGARVTVIVPKLNKMTNVPQTAVFEEAVYPFLNYVSFWVIRGRHPHLPGSDGKGAPRVLWICSVHTSVVP